MTLKKYTPDSVLLSPRLAGLLDEVALQFLLDHLDQLTAQPGRELDAAHGPVKVWGIEIADADDDERTYRVLAAIEEETGSERHTFLTLLALEEQAALEQPPRVRAGGAGWQSRTP